MNIVLTILLLFFLFTGEPDLFDNVHRMAMRVTSMEKCK